MKPTHHGYYVPYYSYHRIVCSCPLGAALHRRANSSVARWIRQRPVSGRPKRLRGSRETSRGWKMHWWSSSPARKHPLASSLFWLRMESRSASMCSSRKSGLNRSGAATASICQRAHCERCSAILQVVRLVRMDRNGFSITDLGREVYRRMISQLNPRTPSAQVNPSTVRQHGRRDYSMATSRAPLRP